MTVLQGAVALLVISLSALLAVGPARTFQKKCEADIRLSANMGRVADALEKNREPICDRSMNNTTICGGLVYCGDMSQDDCRRIKKERGIGVQ